MLVLYQQGGYGNAEERPERLVGFAEGRVPSVHCLFSLPSGNKSVKPRGLGQRPDNL
jgi:hypothetical protein